MNKTVRCVLSATLSNRFTGSLPLTLSGLLQNNNMSTTPNDRPSKLKVEHSTDRKEFFIRLKDDASEDHIAYLQYTYLKPDLVDLEHTVVPSQYRGHGIAKILAQTVFDHFVQQGTYIKPTCTYLQKFYKDNQTPEYTDKIVLDGIKL